MKKINLFNLSLALLIPVLCMLTFSVNAQPINRQWVRTYNGPADGYDYSGPMAIDNSGNVYVAGSSQGTGAGTDICVIKYNSSGVQQWIQRYNGPGNGNDSPASIAVDNSGNVVVAGTSPGAGTGNDYVVLKYNSGGTLIWERRYNGPANNVGNEDDLSAMVIDNIGNIYVTGKSTSATLFDYLTIKYNPAGDSIWVRRFDGGDNAVPQDIPNAIAVDQAGNVYVTGHITTYPQVSNCGTIKYNAAGVLQWVNLITSGISPAGNAIKVDLAGNVYIAANTYAGAPGCDCLTIKINSAGLQQWQVLYNGPGNGNDELNALAIDGFGNVYVTGKSTVSGIYHDMLTIKYNNGGMQQWLQTYNGSGNADDAANTIAVDSSGNIYAAGFSNESGIYNATIIKYNTAGVQQWILKYDTLNTSTNCSSIALDAQSNVYMFANAPINNVYQDMITVKYAQLLGIKPISSQVPAKYSLSQNYPNPFNPSTKIKFDIPSAAQTFLVVYDILGREVSTLVNEQLRPGSYEVTFDASNLASGMYFYKILAGDFTETKKMLLVK